MNKKFGPKWVLTGITFNHNKGVLGISGSNGSGKSTLLRCLAGLLRPTSGNIEWVKEGDTLNPEDLRLHLGYVAPYINLYHELSVRENVDLILQLRGQQSAEQEIENQFKDLQLSGIKDQVFGELSTGQQQRARLACSLIYRPSVLFLDEPGANLDEKGKETLQKILHQFREENKMILLASNNPEELKLADRIFSVE